MELGDLAFRLILILFPGIISTLIYKRLTLRKKWESIDYGINTLLYGLMSYLILQLILSIFKRKELAIWSRLTDQNNLPYLEIFYASLIAFFIGFIVSFIVNKSVINKIGNLLGITSKYGEDSLYYNFLNNHEIHEIHVKDPELDIIYIGFLRYFSEDEKVKELVLENVDLYSYEKAEPFGVADKVYLNYDKCSKIIIEIPKTIENEQTTSKEN